MIYKNFLYFIIAVAIFIVAPSVENRLFHLYEDVLILMILTLLFSHFNRNSFNKLRKNFNDKVLDSLDLRREYLKRVNINHIYAILLFAVEIYIFDLKVILMRIFLLGNVKILVNLSMLFLFIMNFVIVWFWGFKKIGDIIYLGEGINEFLKDNIKFNLVIVIPWLGLTIITDILNILNFKWIIENYGSIMFQLLFVLIFLFLFMITGPYLIIKLWNCEPLEKGELRDSIIRFTNEQGVKFKEIMSWNSLSKSLITAAVVGFFRKFRYLLLTPELMKILNREEIIAVVSHETGHLKRRHILYYLFFFVGFVIFSSGLIGLINILILASPLGINLLFEQGGFEGITFYNFFMAVLFITIFILYFRYIFGYFMRNFEREADLYCFESGVDPENLISSFTKLGFGAGKEKKGSNWHHYSLDERIEFLNKCVSNKNNIVKHKKKVKRSFFIFLSVLALMFFLILDPISNTFSSSLELKAVLNTIEKRIDKTPYDYRLYSVAASIHHELRNWGKARSYYKRSLAIKKDQPETLNNLAWLLVTCEDKSFRDPESGLKFALNAAKLKKEAHIFDTLAEAYLANNMYEKAVKASRIALQVASGKLSYFEGQLKKMERLFIISKKSIKI
ncbi:MAG: M48 family metalloprotease [Acidobacteriota bacterium]